MNSKKALFSLTMTILAISFSITSCTKKNATTTEAKEITLVMAEVNPAETIAGQMDQAFKQKVEELSDGKIKIDLHCGGILGDNKNVREVMSQPNSSIQLTRQGPTASFSKTYGLFLIPYLFENKEHFWRFAQSETAQKLLSKPREEGNQMMGLFYGEEGFRNLFSTKKIESIKDFEGLSMRVTSEKTSQALAASLKMEKKLINFADLYGALSMGQVDVADQPISNYLANHFNEIAPYLILNSHQLGVMETYITNECWDSLSEKQRNILREAGKYASEYCRKISAEEEEKTLKEIEAKGVTIVRITDITPWKEGLADFIKESAADNMELYQEILRYTK